MLYLKKAADIIADRVNDETLSSDGENYARTKNFINEFLFLDLLPRANWKWAKRESTITTVVGTQRYNLPRWIQSPSKINEIIHPVSYRPLVQQTEKDVAGRYDTSGNGDPAEYVIGPRTRSTYTTGTISATVSTNTITGSGTSWDGELEENDVIQVGSYAYTIASVDSDTQVTTVESIVTAIAAGTSYTGLKDRWTIDLYPVPNAVRIFPINAYGIIDELVNDSDVPVLPDQWHHILVKGGVVLALKHNQDDFSTELQEVEMDIRKMIRENDAENDYQEGIQIPRQTSTSYRVGWRSSS